MEFRVTGINGEDDQPGEIVVEAEDEADAAAIAEGSGLRVESVESVDVALRNSWAVHVAGVTHYEPWIEHLCGGKRPEGEYCKDAEAVLIFEDDNQHDGQAVRVDIGGHTVGYLSRAHARCYRRHTSQPVTQCAAVIRAGWKDGADEGYYGILLNLPLLS